MPRDSFQDNIAGVADLIADDVNKVSSSDPIEEGVEGEFEDLLELPMDDGDLLALKQEWESNWNGYGPKIQARQKRNKAYLRGVQRNMTTQDDRVVASNLLFESTATFVPAALAQNPEPVVYSDNTDEGKAASNDLKTMLQYHAEIFSLRKKLGVMVWHWSIYFTAVLKYGWDEEVNDITIDVRKPQNFVFDKDGYVDEFGDFKGKFVGERIETTAGKLAELFPKHATYITLKVAGKMGTSVTYTEWWTDKYCFSTFEDTVLDKHKNEFFNYDVTEKGEDEFGPTQTVTPGLNHFALPKMPYTFLSVFSMQDQPFDFTNLIEQNIANQDRIIERNDQITKNLASANNSVVLSGVAFTAETAQQAVASFYEEGFLLVPNGDVEGAVKRIPANSIPDAVFKAQQNDEMKLREIYGTLGISSQPQKSTDTVRGEILNQNHDTSRIGGGVGDSLEVVSKNVFNWLPQLYAVFYDVPHYGAIMGNARAVEYVALTQQNMERKFVISVAPNSMKPKDEVSEQNLAMERWNNHAIDPINLMKEIDDPDPMESAKQLVMWTTNPQQYAATYFPEVQPAQMAQPGAGVEPQNVGSPDQSIGAPPASAVLSQVPLQSNQVPQ